MTTHPKKIIDAHCHIGEIPPWKFYDLEHPVKPTVYDYRDRNEFIKNHLDDFNKGDSAGRWDFRIGRFRVEGGALRGEILPEAGGGGGIGDPW